MLLRRAEFACVGLTEADCAARGIEVKVGRFPTSANGKSLVGGHTDGMIKVVAGAKYGEILGVHILAEDATDIIEEAALAIRLEATLDELVDTIHCHPTVSEGLREAALAADEEGGTHTEQEVSHAGSRIHIHSRGRRPWGPPGYG